MPMFRKIAIATAATLLAAPAGVAALQLKRINKHVQSPVFSDDGEGSEDMLDEDSYPREDFSVPAFRGVAVPHYKIYSYGAPDGKEDDYNNYMHSRKEAEEFVKKSNERDGYTHAFNPPPQKVWDQCLGLVDSEPLKAAEIFLQSARRGYFGPGPTQAEVDNKNKKKKEAEDAEKEKEAKKIEAEIKQQDKEKRLAAELAREWKPSEDLCTGEESGEGFLRRLNLWQNKISSHGHYEREFSTWNDRGLTIFVRSEDLPGTGESRYAWSSTSIDASPGETFYDVELPVVHALSLPGKIGRVISGGKRLQSVYLTGVSGDVLLKVLDAFQNPNRKAIREGDNTMRRLMHVLAAECMVPATTDWDGYRGDYITGLREQHRAHHNGAMYLMPTRDRSVYESAEAMSRNRPYAPSSWHWHLPDPERKALRKYQRDLKLLEENWSEWGGRIITLGEKPVQRQEVTQSNVQDMDNLRKRLVRYMRQKPDNIKEARRAFK